MSISNMSSTLLDNRPSFLTLHENLRHHVSVRSNKPAIIYEDVSITFGKLYEMAGKISAGLRKRNIGQGDSVGIYLRNHWSYVAIYYALSMSGIVAVPINYMLRSTQLSALLDLTNCKYLFTELSQYDQIAATGYEFLPLCFIDERPDKKHAILAEWLMEAASCPEPVANVGINDSMMVLFSSGTTDLPKGIVLSHLNRILYFFSLGMEYGIRYDEVNLCATPLYHNAAVFFSLNNLYFGSSSVIHRKFDPLRTFQDIERYRVTNAFLVPTQLHQLIYSEERKQFDLSSLRVMVSGAAPLATATKEAILECFPGVELHELYGLTETGLITNLRPKDQLRKVRCAGQAFLNMEFKVVDDRDNPLPPGQVGEIVTRGSTVFDGYVGNEEATRLAWRDGWFHTGDLGKTDDEGFLYVVDRLKDMILSGGVNIYPKDIEDAIYTLSEVQDVAVIGIPDELWGEAVHAVVVCRSGSSLTCDQVIATCGKILASYQLPRSVEFRSELPRNPSGKLLKRMLREEFWANKQTKI